MSVDVEIRGGRLLRGNIAANLRAACASRGSIAEICRRIDINRQQFNKYLSGETLPNPATFRRICSFFSLREQDFMLDAVAFRKILSNSVLQRGGLATLQSPIIKFFHAALAGGEPNIRTGYYFAYMPLAPNSNNVVRAMVVVHKHDDTVQFRRYTQLREAGSGSRYFPAGSHRGFVVERHGHLYFLGLNRGGANELSLMMFSNLMPSPHWLHQGLSLIMAPTGPAATATTLEFLGSELRFREVHRRISILPLDSSEIDPAIRANMVPAGSADTHMAIPSPRLLAGAAAGALGAALMMLGEGS